MGRFEEDDRGVAPEHDQVHHIDVVLVLLVVFLLVLLIKEVVQVLDFGRNHALYRNHVLEEIQQELQLRSGLLVVKHADH